MCKPIYSIQALRNPGRVQVEWNVDDQIQDLYTIKLILQPIVENCYMNGHITTKKDAVIRISICLEQERVKFEVYDNGKGISKQMLENINDSKYAGSGNGFGLGNIRERLYLYFGKEHGFYVRGTDQFAPKAQTTRAEAVVLIERLLRKLDFI